MDSFQPSRGRIFFEVLCALGIVASCVGAWKQTGASALLLAASIAGLYGFVRLFDLGRRKPAMVEEPQRIDFEPEVHEVVVPMIAVEVEEQPPVERANEVAEVVEAAPPRSSSGRRSGGSRKGSGRRAKTQKEPKVAKFAPSDEAVVPWPTAQQVEPPELPAPAEEEFASFPEEEADHPQIAPLFEPEPFVRMPRQAFGRRGRI